MVLKISSSIPPLLFAFNNINICKLLSPKESYYCTHFVISYLLFAYNKEVLFKMFLLIFFSRLKCSGISFFFLIYNICLRFFVDVDDIGLLYFLVYYTIHNDYSQY